MNTRNLLLVGVSINKKARDWDAFDIKTLQEEVDDEKAELETRLYNANKVYISICMCLSLAQAIALHLHYIYGTGPADVPHEGGDDEVRADEATLSPGTQKCGQRTSKC